MSTTLSTSAERPSLSRAQTGSGFIIGPIADSLLIIGAPIVALVIAGGLFALPSTLFETTIRTRPLDWRQIFISVFINAHLFLVYFRSHANPSIFRLYPWRFIAVPLALFVLAGINPIALGLIGVLAVWWDVYHSSLQTFGFGRIYDSKRKNDAAIGRSLDYWMNLLVYVGPILAGAHFVDHLKASVNTVGFLATEGSALNELLTEPAPDFLMETQTQLGAAILAIGVPFGLYYLWAYYRLSQQGYQVSWQKVWLMIITSAVSIYCWGFRSFIDAFWVMNFSHALQYFAIVAFSERRNLTRLFRVGSLPMGSVLAVFWVVSFCLLYGVWSGYFATGSWWMSLTLTTSIMHFWYDGFIWSVTKKQV